MKELLIQPRADSVSINPSQSTGILTDFPCYNSLSFSQYKSLVYHYKLWALSADAIRVVLLSAESAAHVLPWAWVY